MTLKPERSVALLLSHSSKRRVGGEIAGWSKAGRRHDLHRAVLPSPPLLQLSGTFLHISSLEPPNFLQEGTVLWVTIAGH